MSHEALSEQFFAINNLIDIRVEMPETDWHALRRAEPHGGRCAHSYTGDRYDWYEASCVTLVGSAFPGGGPHILDSVGIKKRSYAGSYSKSKPSLALNFGKFSAASEAVAENLIGTKYITLSNCRQDDSFIRQPLGFALFQLAGLPYSRCNFAQLRVNGDPMGLYVNIEPVKEPYIRRNSKGNVAGQPVRVRKGRPHGGLR
ncbi:CotH kinase family protein [Pseudonocardia adelaidensis]|uniref:Uncharacterized protein n=1 Tax=Pseudonocardia adelaidensis TaxID=648754 RepID=A0ABP9P8T8_9PSEU